MRLKDTVRFKILSSDIIGKALIKRDLDKLLQYRFRYEGTIGEVISKYLDKYLDDSEKNDEELRLKLTIDMVQCYYKYRAHPNEYFLFGFRNMPNKRRAQFLTQRYKDYVMTTYVGLGDKRMFLEDKWRFYNFYKKYFKRDAICIGNETDYESFIKFISVNNCFIAKPLRGQCGGGTYSKY